MSLLQRVADLRDRVKSEVSAGLHDKEFIYLYVYILLYFRSVHTSDRLGVKVGVVLEVAVCSCLGSTTTIFFVLVYVVLLFCFLFFPSHSFKGQHCLDDL